MSKLTIGVEGFREFGDNPEVEKPKITKELKQNIGCFVFVFGFIGSLLLFLSGHGGWGALILIILFLIYYFVDFVN